MNFFKDLSEISAGLDLTLRIKSKDGSITVSVLPDTGADIAPLIITGTPAELDQDFINTIRQPLEETKGVVTNLADFKRSVKEMEEKEKGQSKPAKKEEPKKPTEKAAPVKRSIKKDEQNDDDESDEPQEEVEKPIEMPEGTQPQSLF